MTKRIRFAALIASAAVLAIPSVAQAHVTLQPSSVAAGGFTRLDVRVPNERDDAGTTKVEVQMPDGFYFASYEPVPGWTVDVKTEKLGEPVEIEERFEATEQVTRITWTAEGDTRIPPGAFQDFGLSVLMPGEPGDELTFPSLQTYESGEVVRWIGPPDAEEPAPVVALTAAEDEAGTAHAAAEPSEAEPADDEDEDDGNGLSIVALVVGGLGLAAGGASLARRG